MKKILIAAFICLFSSYLLHAQEMHPVSGKPLKYCGTTESLQNLYKNNPGLQAEVERQEMENQKNATKNPSPNSPLPIYTIPVVVHVLHNYGSENISDAQIKDAINIVSRDFRKQNADTATVAIPFKNLIADCEVEFKLAQLDPNGICTNGIDRIVTSETYVGDDGSKLNQWPRNKYLNIWTVNTISSGAAGYSYYPSSTVSNPGIDGIMILHDYVGSIGTGSVGTSRALTHEVGHWANLQHCWGSTNQPGVACGDDAVTDTPVTKGWTSCNLNTNDVCTTGTDENVENYMEYAYCQKMYTPGQKTRVRNALFSSTAGRNNLWSASNLTATGLSGISQLCTADFSVSKKVFCVGTPITFTDLSWNNTPISWQWDVDNDAVIDYTNQNPTHTYNTPGLKTVVLTVGDGVTTKSVTKISYITVLGNTASTQAPYSEGFENSGFPYPDVYTTSASGAALAWNRVTTAAYTGTASIQLDNFNSTTGDLDELISPSIDLSTVTTLSMTFKLAYAQRNSADVDKLRMLISTNCGGSWTQKYSKSGSTLASAGVVSSAFTPSSSSQWRQETVNINSALNSSNFRFKFEFTGDGIGNNIYIDDINITGTPVGMDEESSNEFGLSVFPNPFNENSIVTFSLAKNHNVSIGIYDVVGREIIPLSNSDLNAGTYELPVNNSVLKSGVYFMKLVVDGYSITKKVVVQ